LDDYDVVLQTWKPGALLNHSVLPQNLNDPFSRERLTADSTGEANVERAEFQSGDKVMSEQELAARAFGYFESHQSKWAAGLRDYVIEQGLSNEKFDRYAESFATSWVDGFARRQNSAEMLAIKASIREFDRTFNRPKAGRFVLEPVADDVDPLFTPVEMRILFSANSGLLQAYLSDYVDHLGDEGPSTISDIYVRRGVMVPEIQKIRQERFELSSYSLGIGAVEQFAQLYTFRTKDKGIQSIFSAPLPAVQERVVAFAPFIDGMDLGQLELIIAPPIELTMLIDQGEYGGIREYGFK
jgi:hypothetical protein